MKRAHFKILMVLAASGRSLNGLQIKRAGRLWLMPWIHTPELIERGWVRLSADNNARGNALAITYAGKTALDAEIAARIAP